MQCVNKECEAEIVAGDSGGSRTLVGYLSPPGHDHDDNCFKVAYACADGHVMTLSPINRCKNSKCDWVGKDECFCTNKVDELPEVDQHIRTFLHKLEQAKKEVATS